MDEQVDGLQKDLKEKMAHVQHVEQVCRKQRQELENRAAKLSELDQMTQELKKKHEDCREENLQLSQQLRSVKYECLCFSLSDKCLYLC